MPDVKVIVPTDLDGVSVLLNPQGKVEANYDPVKQYVHSRAGGLLTNGYGTLGNNTNFSRFVFDPTVANIGAGAFKTPVRNADYPIDELIPVSPALTYAFSFYAKSLGGGDNNLAYAYIAPYDMDGNAITPMQVADFFVTVSSDPATNQVIVVEADRQLMAEKLAVARTRGVNFSLNTTNYKSAKQYQYPDFYSRDRLVRVFKTPNQLQYDQNTGVLTGFEIIKGVTNERVGVAIANSVYIYPFPTLSNHVIPNEPTLYRLEFDMNSVAVTKHHKLAMQVAAFIKVGWLLNRGSSDNHQTAIWAVDLRPVTKQINNGAGQVIFTDREATVDLHYNGIQFLFRQVANANKPMLMTGIFYQGTWYGDAPDNETAVNPFV